AWGRAAAAAGQVAGDGDETLARTAASGLYNAASAILLAWEATHPHADARRALLARCVLEHRLSPRDPLAPENPPWERSATDLLLGEQACTMATVAPLLG
ncbi:MAG: DNA alkylation response protein, partial [Acetobacteraceae bacterium]